MEIKSYKEYKKDVMQIINGNKDIDICRSELRKYYLKEHIFKDNLMKRYNNLFCDENNLLFEYLIGIMCGIVSGYATAILFSDDNLNKTIISIIGFILFMTISYAILIKSKKNLNNINDNFIISYEKLLIEQKLKDDYNFEVNPTNVELIKTKENIQAKI